MSVLRQTADGTFETIASSGSPFAEDELVVREITSDGQGGLWVGTDSFIYHWDGSTWERFGGENGGPNYEPVTGIVLRGDVIWISTAYNGLWRKDAGGWLALGREGTGTTYTNVLLPTSDGALWVFAHNAIARLIGDPVEN
jgi:ligand-binding sensor domain-containing protein